MLFKDKFPSLEDQWHVSNIVSFETISAGSNYEAVWFCSLNHTWTSRISTIAYKNDSLDKLNCPFCANRKLLSGFNDLATVNPRLAEEFHPLKNTLLPSQVLYGSRTKLWWQCGKGHEWEAAMVNRKNGTGCPTCYKESRPPKKVSQKSQPRNPLPKELLLEWDYEVNKDIDIAKVSAGSGLKIGWICSSGHKWVAQPGKRIYYNSGCPVCSNTEVVAGFNDLATTHPNLAKEWHPTRNGELTPLLSSYGSKKRVWWLGECGHEWEAVIGKRSAGKSCPICYSSKNEEELYKFLTETSNCDVLIHNRSTIAPYELDFYIPDKKVAVEFNGLYWHSEEQGKGKYYHYDKWKACKDLGIQLIQIWEDDWNRNPELIKRMLTVKLYLTQRSKVFARKTVVKALTQEQSNEFLNEYHVQGAVDGGIRVGLFETGGNVDKPVAVMVLKREPGTEGKTLNLLRYATSVSVVGGFTKLLKHIEREFKPESIVTFSDNTVSDGGLYENNGFKAVRELKPDYMYVVKGERVHKFNYRLKRFRDDPDLEYDEKLSERELALLNNIPRIWDAGKTKWQKNYTL